MPKSLELSIKEIEALFPIKPTLKEKWQLLKDRFTGKKSIYTERQFRYVPLSVTESAEKHLEKTGDVKKVLEYVVNAFNIYRSTVNRGFFAPHYEKDEVYEWPCPVKFSWDNMDAVIIGGEYLNGPILQKRPLTISKEVGDTIEETELHTREGTLRITEEKINVRDIIPNKDRPHKTLKYKIEDMRKVGLVFSDLWQLESLRTYSNPFTFMLKDLKEGNQKGMKTYLQESLEKLSKPYTEPFFK